jgi:hypothetical protein
MFADLVGSTALSTGMDPESGHTGWNTNFRLSSLSV